MVSWLSRILTLMSFKICIILYCETEKEIWRTQYCENILWLGAATKDKKVNTRWHSLMITKQLNFILMERLVLMSPLTSAGSPWAVSWLCCIFYPELHIGSACHWAVRWCFYREPEPPASSSPSDRFSQSSPERSSLTELPSPPTLHAPLTTLSTATKPWQLKHTTILYVWYKWIRWFISPYSLFQFIHFSFCNGVFYLELKLIQNIYKMKKLLISIY